MRPINVEEILEQEKQQALQTQSLILREVWRLRGTNPTRTSALISKIVSCPRSQLQKIPQLIIEGVQAVDAGGVFREELSRAFDHILDSSIFIHDSTSRRTFAELPIREYNFEKDNIIALGKMFYWFVIIHKYIPYPNINPAIIAYAIYGDIPHEILPQVNPAAARVLEMIKSYGPRTTQAAIELEVKQWLEELGMPFQIFMRDLQDRSRGPEWLGNVFVNAVVVGNCEPAFNYFREGFQNDGSVYYLFFNY